MNQQIDSKVFEPIKIQLAGEIEYIVRGGRDLFDRLPRAFEGVSQIGVIGWSSQGPAQAQNLRDSLEGAGIKVKVGLRANSSSADAARKAGFTESNGTLGEFLDVIRESDLVIMLISDAAQAEHHEEIFDAIRPGATLGLSHGFLLGYLNTIGHAFPKNINVIAVCPKGMGPSVRRLYEQGKTINGAGINCSIAVHQDVSGNATDIALGWAVAIGAPYIFVTTLEQEYKSDIFGERGILLGAAYGLTECLYRYFRQAGRSPEEAFMSSAKAITSSISKAISQHGFLGLYNALPPEQRDAFRRAYCVAYEPMLAILAEIYDEVAIGNEIRSVIAAAKRPAAQAMGSIGSTEMWRVGRQLTRNAPPEIDGTTAGIYVATMMAQADLLRSHGHAFSEIVNESIIEALDSLNPYMDFRDVAFMVDNCSITARLGARKWGPRFDYALSEQVIPKLSDASAEGDMPIFNAFLNNPVHDALATCQKYRPSVDIAVLDT